MKAWKNRNTLPIDQNTGTIFKIQMYIKGELITINMGAHLMTNEDTGEVTICSFNNKCTTYEMGHTYSSPATLQEIADWVAEMQERQARIKAEYEREMIEESLLQRSGNIY